MPWSSSDMEESEAEGPSPTNDQPQESISSQLLEADLAHSQVEKESGINSPRTHCKGWTVMVPCSAPQVAKIHTLIEPHLQMPDIRYWQLSSLLETSPYEASFYSYLHQETWLFKPGLIDWLLTSLVMGLLDWIIQNYTGLYLTMFSFDFGLNSFRQDIINVAGACGCLHPSTFSLVCAIAYCSLANL